MATVINIACGVLFVLAAVTSCFLARRYRGLRDYTFWVEQCLLQHRPETYIPNWRKRQRAKDICKKEPSGQESRPEPSAGRELNCRPEQAPLGPPKVRTYTA
jgi:hypothetical protein